MTKKHLIPLILLVLTLTVLLSGCGQGAQNLDGMYVATFEMNGGTLDLKSSKVSTKINFAYEPDSYILDPSTYGNYSLSRPGYRFTGWYTTPDCRDDQKWDFSTGTITTESLTLYAGWEKEIIYTFSVCYSDGTAETVIGTYNVSAGDVFEDYRNYAGKRDDFTPIGYYSDPACGTPWDFTSKHPGGEVDTDIRVYVDYIPGKWILVDSYNSLVKAIGSGNIYLTADIDCEGKELSFGNFRHIFEGNGFTIRNCVVNKSSSALMPSVSLFQRLDKGAEILNVSFENVTYRLFEVTDASRIKVASLAKEATDCVVHNVSITGTFETDYTGEFPRLLEPFYEEDSTGDVENFTATITIVPKS